MTFHSERVPIVFVNYDGTTTRSYLALESFAVRPQPRLETERETDADLHAEDVWHTRYDGTEDVQR